ncbi:MAG: ABC-F family ATP-binding cassette domain-containing protein, partial [Bacteroidales bacterium]|nr:ABC-F family ATP-binding cassette domain-containing protein [Bacteroidales bacterium]
VFGHCHEHLAQIFHLLVLFAGVLYTGELCNAFHQIRHRFAELMSGGERTRLAMIKLLLEPVNMLILDEPTNHLDLKTKDILKEALINFDGTLIVVSHDRDFLDGLVSKVYEFSNKRVIEHLGGVYDFLEKKKMDNLREIERKN